ncbi:MAG: ion channel, partial [Pseudomonadota bacterium]
TPAMFKSAPDQSTQLPVKRVGISLGHFGDFYHWVMAAPWWQFLLTAALAYLCINVTFASVYLLGGDAILNARPASFVDAFIFSFQTSTTIGYGYLLPKTPFAHVVVMFDVIVGILYVAVVTGLAFAKFARPRPRVVFSDKALIVDYENNQKALVFRVANGRSTQIVNAEVTVGLIRKNPNPHAGLVRRMYELDLVANQSPFFALSWMVVHVIDEHSPLFGLNEAQIKSEQIRVHATFVGIDDVYAQTVHWWHAYTAEHIVFANKFVDMVTFNSDDSAIIDYTKIHLYE